MKCLKCFGYMANEKITEAQFIRMAECLQKEDITLAVGCKYGFFYDDFAKNSDFEANLKAVKNYFETNQPPYISEC